MPLKQSAQSPPLIFRSYGPKSTHNTQLTEGVIPPDIGVNLGYIRYMPTSVQSQGHYGGRGGGALGSLMGPSANSNERGAISAPSFRKSLLALPLRQLCPAESLNPRPRSASCPRSGSVARRIKVENRGEGGGGQTSERTGRRTRSLPGKERVQLGVKVNCRDRQPSSGWQPQDSSPPCSFTVSFRLTSSDLSM